MSFCRYDLPPSKDCESEECTRRHDLGIDYKLLKIPTLFSKIKSRCAQAETHGQFEESILLQMMLDASEAITLNNSTDESLKKVIKDQLINNFHIINEMDINNITDHHRILLKECYILSEFI